MSENQNNDLIEMAAELACAYLSNNALPAGDVPALIRTVHEALAGLGSAAEAPAPGKPAAAVTRRESIANPSRILSMIDGKPYASLKRHIGRHGYTPETYRAAFDLPADYPMVAPAYSEKRSALARQIGFGRKPKSAAGQTADPSPPRSGLEGALDAAKSHLTGDAAPKRGRGRPRKVAAADVRQG